MSTPNDLQGPPRDSPSSADRGPAPTLLPRGVMPGDPRPSLTSGQALSVLLAHLTKGELS